MDVLSWPTYDIFLELLDRNFILKKNIEGVASSRVKFNDDKWIIMLEKCGRPDINVFHIKWIIGNHGNWKNQNPGGRFGATS